MNPPPLTLSQIKRVELNSLFVNKPAKIYQTADRKQKLVLLKCCYFLESH